MAYIDNEEINKIRASANIVDIIGSYIPLTLKGHDYKCVCPFHEDHSPSMSISTSKQIYKCFSCNAAGNVFTFVENYENVSFSEAVKIVANKIGYQINGEIKNDVPVKYQKEYDLMNLTQKYFQNNLSSSSGLQAKKYLSERGINDKIIKDFGIGLALDDATTLSNFLIKKEYDVKLLEDVGLININAESYYDVFSRRITFPLTDAYGHIVGFSSRIYRGEETSKYINTKETYIYKKGNNLFNYYLAKEQAKKEKCLIIVEGQMDAIRVYESDIKNVVALMGTALTKEQVELIKKIRCKVILCLDNDDAGSNATMVNGDILEKAEIKTQVIRLSGAKDPDEYILKYGAEALKKLILDPIDYFDFKMTKLKENININNTEELSGYINNVLENLSQVADPIVREVTITKLSNEYKISKEVLNEKLRSLKPIATIAKEIFAPKVVKKIKKDSLQQSIERVLYYMMNDIKYIKMYQNKLGFFDDKLYRTIANEIVFYSQREKNINIADFITYAKDKEQIKDKVLEIVDNFEEELVEDSFIQYIKIIEKKNENLEIKKLKEQLKNELDKNSKIKIAQRITEIKKGSVLNGSN